MLRVSSPTARVTKVVDAVRGSKEEGEEGCEKHLEENAEKLQSTLEMKRERECVRGREEERASDQQAARLLGYIPLA